MTPTVCLLSGIDPDGGPSRLLDHEDLDTVSTTMASEILSYQQSSLDLTELTSIVSYALQLTLPPRAKRSMYDRAPNLPVGISDWEYFDCIAIGHFDPGADSNINHCHSEPSGRNVQIRRISQYDAYGHFYSIIIDDPDAPDGSRLREEDLYHTYVGTALNNCNFFVMRGCLEYLRAWLDPTLPERADSMTLEGELYEIVNASPEEREHSGILSRIQYGDITKTFEHYQLRFLKARKDSKHTARAINMGLRGRELLPPIFRDFQCWLSMRPDLWPCPTDSPAPAFAKFSTSCLHNPFSAFPTELLFLIFSQLSIHQLLTLSAASQSLRMLITEPEFLNEMFRAAVLSGSLFWILPAATLPGEENRAHRAAMEWLAVVPSAHDSLLAESPFHDESFPYVAFVHACYESENMQNRERLWKIVKQLDGLWRDYRLHGWGGDTLVKEETSLEPIA